MAADAAARSAERGEHWRDVRHLPSAARPDLGRSDGGVWRPAVAVRLAEGRRGGPRADRVVHGHPSDIRRQARIVGEHGPSIFGEREPRIVGHHRVVGCGALERAGTVHVTSVAIIGGGLAGITAALRCADAGYDVTLYESRPKLGGLTHSFRRGDIDVDNGQHVFLRCCTSYRALLDRLGVAENVALQDRLDIPIRSPKRTGTA